MSDTIDSAIDNSQQNIKNKLNEAKPKEHGLFLREEVYTSKVDEIQQLGEQIQSEAARKYLGEAKSRINQLLLSIAQVGEKYLKDVKTGQKNEGEVRSSQLLEMKIRDLGSQLESYKPNVNLMAQIEKAASQSDTVAVIMEIDQKAKSNSEYFGGADYMSKIAAGLDRLTAVKSQLVSLPGLPSDFSAVMLKSVDGQIQQFSNRKMNALKYAIITQKYNQYFSFKLDDNQQITNLKTTEAFKKLPEDQQKSILAEIISVCKISVEEEVEMVASPQLLRDAQGLFEQGKFVEARTKLEEFGKYLDSPEFMNNKTLCVKKAEYKEKIDELIKQIDVRSEHKSLFDAESLLASGNHMEAKKLLLDYITKTFNPPQPEYLQGAKQLLKNIALIQLNEAQDRFEKVTPPFEANLAGGGGSGYGGGENKDYQDYVAVRKALDSIRIALNRGEYLDFDEALVHVNPPLDLASLSARNEAMDVMSDQLLLEQGRPGMLKLAQKYRRIGNQELAEKYYREYFKDRLSRPDIMTRDQWKEKCLQNTSMLTVVASRVSEIKRKLTDPAFRSEFQVDNPTINVDSFDEKTAFNMLMDKMVDESYSKAAGRTAMMALNQDPKSFGADEQNFRDYADLKGVHRTGTWREGWLEFTDKEWTDLCDKVKTEAVIAVACLVFTGGLGNVVKTVRGIPGRVVGILARPTAADFALSAELAYAAPRSVFLVEAIPRVAAAKLVSSRGQAWMKNMMRGVSKANKRNGLDGQGNDINNFMAEHPVPNKLTVSQMMRYIS